MATETFNADFYVVAATVIPVLFLALMLPGGILARFARWEREWRRAQIREHGADFVSKAPVHVRAVYELMGWPVALALAFGLVGEIPAILALDHRHATATEHAWTLVSVIGLAALAALSVIGDLAFSGRFPKLNGDGGESEGE
jgi:hypothetical protein